MASLVVSTQPRNILRFTITGNATGAGVMRAGVAGTTASIVPGAADTPTVSATALAAALDVALDATFVVTSLAGVVTVVGVGQDLLSGFAYSTDATQAVAYDGFQPASRALAAGTAAATGRPTSAADGSAYPFGAANPSTNNEINVAVTARLMSWAGGTETAYYRLWAHSTVTGWQPVTGAEALALSLPTGAPYSASARTVLLGLRGVTRFAVELLGAAASGGNLPGSALDAWIEAV
jgi:hypothetical protein